jgi:hypothetical protein
MSFSVGQPTHDSIRKCYELEIRDGPSFQGRLVSPFEPDLRGARSQQYEEFITEFLKQASHHFSKPLDKAIFIQRISHSYSTDEDLSGSSLKSLYWIPARVLFYPSLYEFQWILAQVERVERVEEAPGCPPDKPVEKKPILTMSEQKRLRKKIRQARLKCALARLHVEQITEKYYNKYGNFDGLSDADSELSSDFELGQNEAP